MIGQDYQRSAELPPNAKMKRHLLLTSVNTERPGNVVSMHLSAHISTEMGKLCRKTDVYGL